ncbi:MAG: hypothetical protein ACRCTD_07960 [Beijerinckiaceae bacterium]
MFDAIVTTSDDPFELADTLAALVPAVIDGVLRRVIIVAERQPSVATVKLVEESGADLVIIPGDVAARWQAALTQRPRGWHLCLAAGLVPVGEWREAATRFAARAQPGERAVFQVSGPWSARLAVWLRRMGGQRVIAAGQIVSGPEDAGKTTTLPAFIEDRRAGAGGVFPIFLD